MMRITEYGEIEEKAEPGQLRALSDEALKGYAEAGSRTGGFQDEQHDAFEELWRRYKALKQRYEPRLCIHSGVVDDCAICLEEGAYG